MNQHEEPENDVYVQTAKETVLEDFLRPAGRGIAAGAQVAGYLVGLTAAVPTTHRLAYNEDALFPALLGTLITGMIGKISIHMWDQTHDTDVLATTLGVMAATNVISAGYEVVRKFRNNFNERLENKLRE